LSGRFSESKGDDAMAVTSMVCPECQSGLKLSTPVSAGRKIQCPKCMTVFPAPAVDSRVPPRPPAPPPQASAPVHRPRLDDEYKDDFEDAAEEHRPGASGRKQGGKGLLIGLIAGGVGLLIIGGVLGVFLLMKSVNGQLDRTLTFGSNLAWQEFSSQEGGFSILMPGAPTTENLEGLGAMYQVQLPKEDMAFIVSYSRLAQVPDAQRRLIVDQIYTLNRDAAVAKAKGKLVHEESINWNGYAGKEFHVEMPGPGGGKGLMICRVIATQSRYYNLSVSGPNLSPNSPDVVKFLGSFKKTDGEVAQPADNKSSPEPKPAQPSPRSPPRNKFGPDETITIIITGIRKNETGKEIEEKVQAMTDSKPSSMRAVFRRGVKTITLAPVKDPQAFADKIDFGRVTSVEGRTIKMVSNKQ
jgi:hypothetical protein